jgi:hypothetical protein
VWTAVHAQPTTLTEDQYNDAYRSAMKQGDVDAMKQELGVNTGQRMAEAIDAELRAATITENPKQISGFQKAKKWLTNSK